RRFLIGINATLGAKGGQKAAFFISARSNSYDKERPVAVCDDISCWSQNRRAVTTLGGAGS
ncbi:hypothetical protein NKI56_15930, partial [Mesorhizobium sp. M0622]